ncbi:hypothetical protein SPI_01405 [Niveomyces insectorum RCEF 264]|uniref:Uncharacterized protein n=1 Tax=Niveomyces insectorum RCEF 264 TaxID=1081102 RepID=A0A167YXX0_9HYPO|nr:hypothetical protein SPI_01405 [Niveomyces insectorum RCEF 264]
MAFVARAHQPVLAVMTVTERHPGLFALGLVVVSALLFVVVGARYTQAIRQRTTPEKTAAASAGIAGSTASARRHDIASLFPPSRRFVLPHVLPDGLHIRSVAGNDDDDDDDRDNTAAIPVDHLRAHALPSTRAVSTTAERLCCSPTGFTLPEIQSLLGTFPDYAVLSGVRHPQPCPDGFDLARARFRPYRPFRWRYHQTMDSSPTTGSN